MDFNIADMSEIDNTDLFALALPDIKREEGLRLTAYPDPLSGGDPWTIGYGSTGPGIAKGVVWTQAQADAALEADAARACRALDASMPWWRGLDIPRQAVLLDMCYNLGIGGLEAFHNTLAAVKTGQWAKAAAGMLDSLWAKQVHARADRLAEQMLTGIHQP